MGDILNIGAVHNAGDPELNVGIRGNRFVLKKNGNVVYLADYSGNRMDLDADVLLSDGTSVETRILEAEALLSEMDDILDHLYVMYISDDYWAALEVDDGVILVDDASEYPIVDNWSLESDVCSLESDVAGLRNRIYALENSLAYIESSMVNVLRILNVYDSRLDKIESELIALRTTTSAALNHRFLVDDS